MSSKYKKSILASARKIFSEKSFEQVTIKEICQDAGVANSTFYYHFKTKEELMDCLRMKDDHPTGSDLLHILAADDLLEQVLTACTMCAARAVRNGCTLTTQYYKCRLNAEILDDARNQLYAQEAMTAKLLIARAQQQGLIRNQSPADKLASAALGLTNSKIIIWCISDGSFDLMQAAREALLVLFNICC